MSRIVRYSQFLNSRMPQFLNCSCGFQYLPRSKTTCTDPYVAHSSILYCPHPLQIGIPSPFGLVICVADVVARLRAFSAYLANLGHYFLPPIRAISPSIVRVRSLFSSPKRLGRLSRFPAIELSNTSSLI